MRLSFEILSRHSNRGCSLSSDEMESGEIEILEGEAPTDPKLVILLEQVRAFPKLPGVYIMKNEAGDVIYVGKAKDLRNRVKTYFMGGDGRAQIEFLLKKIHSIEKIVTAHDQQAIVLERDLIAKYKPRYNIRLKDDKAFLSIRVDEDAKWPRLELVRKRHDDGARYFGPYSFSYELRSLLEIIKRVVPLRTCANTVMYNRSRPCLEYQIKRCAGPCCLPVDEVQYRKWVKQAIAILEGKTDKIIADLTALMEKASEELRFEDAAFSRDRLAVLSNFKAGVSLVSSRGENRDVFGIYREESLAALSVIKVRGGRVSDSINFSFSGVSVSTQEILESSVTQFYEGGREIPEEIVLAEELLNFEMIEELLSEKRGSKVNFVVPERGIKSRLLDLAVVNAKEHYLATFDAEAKYQELAKKLSVKFKLRQVPRRIECVDISNFQGTDMVGAIVSFFDGVPDKSSYRKYKIAGEGKPDDFASINEVVGRRIERGLAEGTLPDLLIVDGGPGQLAMALEARDALSAELEIVSLAKMRTEADTQSSEIKKKPERVYLEGEEEPILLDESDEITNFVSRVRDEVHRFVITFHRSTRAKRVFRSILDEIPGVGPERRQRLLKVYGAVEHMKSVSADEIAKNGRMPRSLAEKVLKWINEKN